MIAAAILGAEVLFWVLLLGGLAVRYVLRRDRTGLTLLALTPVVDTALIALTYVDLYRGADVTFFHGLSPVYVGFTFVFGPSIVRAMDARVARRVGPEPHREDDKPRRTPREHEAPTGRRDLARTLAAGTLSVLLLGVGLLIVGWERSFWITYWIITVVFIVAAWPFVERFAEKRKKNTET